MKKLKNKNLPIIDAHHHFWDLSLKKNPWLDKNNQIPFRYGDYSSICKNFLLSDYKKVSKNHNIVKTIHMESEWDPTDPVGETIWLQKLYDISGFPNALVGHSTRSTYQTTNGSWTTQKQRSCVAYHARGLLQARP